MRCHKEDVFFIMILLSKNVSFCEMPPTSPSICSALLQDDGAYVCSGSRLSRFSFLFVFMFLVQILEALIHYRRAEVWDTGKQF